MSIFNCCKDAQLQSQQLSEQNYQPIIRNSNQISRNKALITNLTSPKASLKSINSIRKLNSSKTVNGVNSIHLVETVDVIGDDSHYNPFNNNNNNSNNRFLFNTPQTNQSKYYLEDISYQPQAQTSNGQQPSHQLYAYSYPATTTAYQQMPTISQRPLTNLPSKMPINPESPKHNTVNFMESMKRAVQNRQRSYLEANKMDSRLYYAQSEKFSQGGVPVRESLAHRESLRPMLQLSSKQSSIQQLPINYTKAVASTQPTSRLLEQSPSTPFIPSQPQQQPQQKPITSQPQPQSQPTISQNPQSQPTISQNPQSQPLLQQKSTQQQQHSRHKSSISSFPLLPTTNKFLLGGSKFTIQSQQQLQYQQPIMQDQKQLKLQQSTIILNVFNPTNSQIMGWENSKSNNNNIGNGNNNSNNNGVNQQNNNIKYKR